MLKRKITSVVAALVLALGAHTPFTTARGNQPALVTSAAAVSTRAADETRQTPKRKGNKLARALSAPFRALARLFGGGDRGRKSPAPETAKAAPQPAPETRVAVENKSPEPEQKPATPEPVRAAAPVTPERAAPTVAPSNVAAPSERARVFRPSESTNIVRPSGVAPAPAPGKMFIPRIEGVAPDSLSQGRALLQHGYLNEAIAELSIAATVGPGLVEANNLLGLAYDRIGWHGEAAACYERALSVSPKDPVVLANLGNSLFLADDYRGALKRLKQSARISPGVALVHNNIGIVEARLGRYDSAFESFARASNKYDAHLKLAGILEIEKRDRDAVKHYEAALRLQPGTNAVLERLVALYDRTGRKRDAEEARRTLGQPANPQKTATGGGG